MSGFVVQGGKSRFLPVVCYVHFSFCPAQVLLIHFLVLKSNWCRSFPCLDYPSPQSESVTTF